MDVDMNKESNAPLKIIINHDQLGITAKEFDDMLFEAREERKRILGDYGSFDILNKDGTLHYFNYGMAALFLAETLSKRAA